MFTGIRSTISCHLTQWNFNTHVLTTFQDWPANWRMLGEKYVIYLPKSVRIGKNCALGLEYGPRPAGTVFLYTDLPAGK